jgi:DNA ligase-1
MTMTTDQKTADGLHPQSTPLIAARDVNIADLNSDQAYEILTAIAETRSRTEKENILGVVIQHPLMNRILRYTSDPFITFGITPPDYTSNGFGRQFRHDDHNVWNLLDLLANRKLTGNNAIDLTRKLLEGLSPSSAMLICNILKKDLRCGITEKTVNKLVPGLIPTFDVMLAHKYETKRVKTFPVAVEPKLDGVRVLCIMRNGRAKFFSRTGKPFPAIDHLAADVEETIAAALDDTSRRVTKMHSFFVKMLSDGANIPGVVLDGEVVSGSFNKTVGDVRRKEEAALDAEYVIFDALPVRLFLDHGQQVIPIPYQVRRALVEFLDEHTTDKLRVNTMVNANSHEQIQNYYQVWREQGLEGAIVKPLDAHYSKKRSPAWLKIKGAETEDLIVVDSFEGEGKYQGMLGGFVTLREHNDKGVHVNVGGGFSDQQRKEFWENREALVGRMIEVEYHEVTPDGSLRHPRFVGFRDDPDHPGEKI